jgi:murein DD-endopeptidase MepM/ murein hydrolase activator NlpD
MQPQVVDDNPQGPETQNPDWCLPPTRQPGSPLPVPTPDAPRSLSAIRTENETYTVQPGDSLAAIASLYGVPIASLVNENALANPDVLEIGQILVIPAPQPSPPGPAFKIIPDSELVNGPVSACFNVTAFIQQSNGYLVHYSEPVDGRSMTGAEIVSRIAAEYAVNPRLLLALVEYQSAWLTSANPDAQTLQYPLGNIDPWREGLYRQLAWGANQLNLGYYLWQINGLSTWVTADAAVIPIANTINPGTAGIQHLFSLLLDETAWRAAVGETGFFQTYQDLFGYPFDLAVEPLVPLQLKQPAFQLPFEKSSTWSFTGGPHGGWGEGSAWAALDFAPPGDAEGCVPSDAWVVALADGKIVYAADGVVIQDLDGDGSFQTGWSLFYGHIETRGRVPLGTTVKAGDHIGHPSCEGGVSSGTHVHVARRYNGEWIATDGSLPFVMDGWVSQGTGVVYNGSLKKDGRIVEAWDERKPENQIHR